jgi:hypothetical protein
MKNSVCLRFFILIFSFAIISSAIEAGCKSKMTFAQCLTTDGEWVSARFIPTGFIIDDARKACMNKLGDKWAGSGSEICFS